MLSPPPPNNRDLRKIEIRDPQHGPSQPPADRRFLGIDLEGDGLGPALKAELEKNFKGHSF